MQKNLLCPRCNVELKADIVTTSELTVEIDVCTKCQGMWFNQGELDKVDKNIKPSLIEFRKVPGIEAQLESLTCPECGGIRKMKKEEHFRDSNVIVDVCEECGGIWLDKGELNAILKEGAGSLMFGFVKKIFDKKKK